MAIPHLQPLEEREVEEKRVPSIQLRPVKVQDAQLFKAGDDANLVSSPVGSFESHLFIWIVAIDEFLPNKYATFILSPSKTAEGHLLCCMTARLERRSRLGRFYGSLLYSLSPSFGHAPHKHDLFRG